MPSSHFSGRILCFIIGFLLIFTLQIVESSQNGAEHKKEGKKLPESIDLTETVIWAENEETNKNFKQALELYDKVIHIYEEELGPEHSKTIDVLMRKYRAYYVAKMYKDALELGWKIYKMLEKIHGKEHLNTVEFLVKLSYTYSETENYEKAEQLLKRAYRLTKAQLGQNHPKTIKTLFHLADAIRKGWRKDPRKLDSALRYYQKVYDVGVGANDPEIQMGEGMGETTLQALKHIGDILGLQHKYNEATEVFQKVLDIRTKTLGEDHPLTQELKKALFYILTATGQTGKAKKILGKDDQELDKDDHALYILVQGKAAAFRKTGKTAKAIEILTALYEQEISKKGNRPLPPTIFSVLEDLLQLNQDVEDFDQLQKWANVLIDLIQDETQTQTQGQGQGQKVKTANNALENENMILVLLRALESLISIHISKNEEDKVETYLKSTVEVTKGHLQFFDVVQKLFEITELVANFKIEIGKRGEAIQILSDFVIHNPRFSYWGLETMTTIALASDDYKLMQDIALKFLSNQNQNQNDLKNLEEELELEEKLEISDRVAQYLCEKATALFTREKNYEEAFSLYKTVEVIWPNWYTEEEGNEEWMVQFLVGISSSALMLGKFEETLFYKKKETALLKTMLTRESNEQKREDIFERIQISERLQETIKTDASIIADIIKNVYHFQESPLPESESESKSESESESKTNSDKNDRSEL